MFKKTRIYRKKYLQVSIFALCLIFFTFTNLVFVSAFSLQLEGSSGAHYNDFPNRLSREFLVFGSSVLNKGIFNLSSTNNAACPPLSCTAGKNVGDDFMVGVLDKLAIPATDFSIKALMSWIPYENTNACWNPLATTHKMTEICNFNSVGVQHYQSKEMGMEATASTLILSYYAAIRTMLMQQGFERDAIQQSLETWGSCKGVRCDPLITTWFDLYNENNSNEDNPLDLNATSTATVLLLDTSGSMDELDMTGYSKLEAAQRATRSILDVIKTETASGLGYVHQAGLVSFDNGPAVEADLTENLTSVQSAADRLYANGGTGMADGLSMAMDVFNPVDPSFNKMIVLLSDGMPNIGLNQDQTLDEAQIVEQIMGLVGTARSKGICIHTIGFGIPGQTGGVSGEASINEELLRRIAAESGCGQYYNASNAIELANAFIEIRHDSLGEVLFSKQGVISQNEDLDLGTVPVGDNQELLLITLNWPGSELDLQLTDPAGVLVDSNYPNANVNTTSSLVSMTVTEPMAGNWRVKVFGSDVPQGQTNYNVLLSTRAKPKPDIQPVIPPTDNIDLTSTGSASLIVVVLIIASVVLVSTYAGRKDKNVSGKTVPYAALITQATGLPQQTIPLTANFLIGRRSAANLALESPEISRDHAQIYASAGQWYIRDLNSRLGTYVNGQKVGISPLKPGDKIKIGRYEWVFWQK